MRRRRYLVASAGLAITATGASITGASATILPETASERATGERDDAFAADSDEFVADSDEFVEDPIEFEGEGATVTDEFALEAGVTIAEAVHEGESNFIVELIPVDDGQPRLLVNVIGDFDGASGTIVEDGTYLLDVDADGPWELAVLQPEAAEDEAAPLPVEIDGDGPSWDGPYLFDGLATATGSHEGQGNFIVEVLPQDGTFSELVFNEIGPFEGETTLDVDGVGYVASTADGPWTLTIE